MNLDNIKPEHKIIADHLRCACFLIADGVVVSNEGRGYVLRRILRRAMLQFYKLGVKQPIMFNLVDPLIANFRDAYPELVNAKDNIVENIKFEEEKFLETLDKGMKILDEELLNHKNKSNNNYFDGQVAFKLYDTFGFPLDLTIDIIKEYNLELDQNAFDAAMLKQKQLARKNWSGSGEQSLEKIFFDIKDQYGATEFLGYQHYQAQGFIQAIIIDDKIVDNSGDFDVNSNKTIAVIINQTPFYGTSGGQRGDVGTIIAVNNNHQFTNIVIETKKIKDLIIHYLDVCQLINNHQNNLFLVSNLNVEAKIDVEYRKKCASNHSATHLLHKALKEILGSSISQKGSNVESKGLSFDFNFNRSLTNQEIIAIEDNVNHKIISNNIAKTVIMDIEEAKKTDAIALFGENYSSKVRVVSIGDSLELCGGTHVKASGDIGSFKIISEKSIASGIRRIEALTGFEVIKYYRDIIDVANNNNLALQQDIKKLDKEIIKLKQAILLNKIENIEPIIINNNNLIIATIDNADSKDLKEIINNLKKADSRKNNHCFLVFAINDDKILVLLNITDDLTVNFNATNLINQILPIIGGKNIGGKPDFAMGGGVDKSKITEAINIFKQNFL